MKYHFWKKGWQFGSQSEPVSPIKTLWFNVSNRSYLSEKAVFCQKLSDSCRIYLKWTIPSVSKYRKKPFPIIENTVDVSKVWQPNDPCPWIISEVCCFDEFAHNFSTCVVFLGVKKRQQRVFLQISRAPCANTWDEK